MLAGPAAYAVTTAATPHTGAIPAAGPGSRAARPGGMPGGMPGGSRLPGGMPFGGPAGRTGGLLQGSSSSPAIDRLLRQDAGGYTWAAAAVGSNVASGYQLSSEQPVMAIGGFNGSDPSPTLAQFERYVAQGRVHWFIGDGSRGGMRGGVGPGGSTSTAIAAWVSSHFTARTVDGVTLYDLSGGAR